MKTSKIKPHTDRFIYTHDKPAKIKVNIIRLDDFITTQKLPRPNLLVVDVEGAEYAALKGATECLRSCKYLYIEFVPHHLFNVAHIDVKTFLSVILPFFNRMKIVDGSLLNMNNIFGNDKIHARLVDLYVNGVCVDLLFFKEKNVSVTIIKIVFAIHILFGQSSGYSCSFTSVTSAFHF